MMESYSILEQAARAIATSDPSSTLPSPSTVIEALLQAEKNTKQNKERYSFESLVGTWKLCFITGTKKKGSGKGTELGSGRYIPRWVNIQLSYATSERTAPEPSIELGWVENYVTLGLLQLTLSGPTKFLSGKNILAFDFTRIWVKLGGKRLYQGYIRGGVAKEEEFDCKGVGKQAFFAYFFLDDRAIAARGRGGGLALWGKSP